MFAWYAESAPKVRRSAGICGEIAEARKQCDFKLRTSDNDIKRQTKRIFGHKEGTPETDHRGSPCRTMQDAAGLRTMPQCGHVGQDSRRPEHSIVDRAWRMRNCNRGVLCPQQRPSRGIKADEGNDGPGGGVRCDSGWACERQALIWPAHVPFGWLPPEGRHYGSFHEVTRCVRRA